jgi:O-antigen/teichoic acid export membrane protein
VSTIKKNFARGAFWSFIGKSASNVAGFVIFAVLARLLGPVEFGIVAFAAVFIDFSRVIALAGLPTALIRAPEWDEVDASTVFWGNAALAIALAIVVGAGGGYLLGRFYSSELQWVLLALSTCLVVDALRATHEAKLQRDFEFKSLATRTALATAGAGMVGVALAFAGFGVWALVINRIANSAIQTAIVWRATAWAPRRIFRRERFVEMLSFGVHVGSTIAVGMVDRHVATLIAGFLIGPVAVGFLGVSSRMLHFLLDLTTTPLRRTALASFSRLKDTAARARGYRVVTRLVAFVSFPMSFGVAALAADLVVLLFGERWADSAFILSMLALIGGVGSLHTFVPSVLTAEGLPRLVLINASQALVSNIVVSLATAPFGISIFATGIAIRVYVGIIPRLFLLKRALGLPPGKVMRDILPSFLSAAVMLLIILVISHYVLQDYSRLARLIILVPLGALVYASMVAVFFRGFVLEVWRDVEPLLGPALERLTKR